MRIRKILLIMLLALMTGCASYAVEPFDSSRPQVHAFIEKMASKHGFDRNQIAKVLEQATPQPRLIANITKPHEAKPWYIYRKTFLNQQRVKDGVTFWRQHAQTLTQAEQQYGVPANIIVAIIGVETNYGKIKGEHKVLDALSTLAFNYPPRARFFQDELENFFLMSREEKFLPAELLGSYAGAFGLPQFMPSSFRHYAVSHTPNGHPDIINNADDAILSVANYFKKHGWHTGEIIAVPAIVKGNGFSTINTQNLKPQNFISALKERGITSQISLPNSERAALLQLSVENGSDFWLGLHNFYVISHYNPRLNYTMAVYQLSEQLKRAF